MEQRGFLEKVSIYTFVLSLMLGFVIILMWLGHYFSSMKLPFYLNQIIAVIIVVLYAVFFFKGASLLQKEIKYTTRQEVLNELEREERNKKYRNPLDGLERNLDDTHF